MIIEDEHWDWDHKRLNKSVTIECCSIRGEFFNSPNNRINCKNNEHKKKIIIDYHTKTINYLKKYLEYLLELKRLTGDSCMLNDGSYYSTDEETISVLFFHLKTELIFIKNSNIFRLVCDYIGVRSYSYYFSNITEKLNRYFLNESLYYYHNYW